MKAQYKELSDAQVLTQLHYKRVRLQWQLDRVNIAIRAYEMPLEIDALEIAQYELEGIENNTEVDDDLTKAILLYNPKSSNEKKILFALNNIGSGDAYEITQYILKVDGHIKDANRLFDRVTYYASRMYKAGKLDVDKVGKKNRYRLKN
jgi:hypothetical protein